jgi:hypothetical protein
LNFNRLQPIFLFKNNYTKCYRTIVFIANSLILREQTKN